jgi:hypothetical protein
MAKKKKETKAKTKGKAGKARSKKLSVKKRAVKDLDAGKARSTKGGALAPADRAVKLGTAAVKFSDVAVYQKIY